MIKFSLILFFLLSNISYASTVEIPLSSQLLRFHFDKEYKMKKKCTKHATMTCYELWSDSSFLSIYISKINPNKQIEDLCKKTKTNNHNLKYCNNKNSIQFIKDEKLVSISIKSSSINSKDFEESVR